MITDHGHDDQPTDDRNPPQPVGVLALLMNFRRQPVVGAADDTGEKYIRFVHQRLAAIALQKLHGILIAEGGFQRDGFVHLLELVGDDRAETREKPGRIRVAAERALEDAESARWRMPSCRKVCALALAKGAR